MEPVAEYTGASHNENGSLCVHYELASGGTGEVKLFPEGIVVTEFGGCRITDAQVCKFVSHAVSVWQTEKPDEETEFRFNDERVRS